MDANFVKIKVIETLSDNWPPTFILTPQPKILLIFHFTVSNNFSRDCPEFIEGNCWWLNTYREMTLYLVFKDVKLSVSLRLSLVYKLLSNAFVFNLIQKWIVTNKEKRWKSPKYSQVSKHRARLHPMDCLNAVILMGIDFQQRMASDYGSLIVNTKNRNKVAKEIVIV